MSDYNQDVQIDMYNLENEWVVQSQLYMKYAELYANAIRSRDRLKERLDVIKAGLDSEIRNDSKTFGITKITESAVANAIVVQPEYSLLNTQLNDATEDMHILAGAKQAMEHKKSALENLTKLHLSGYFSEPNIPTEAKEMAINERKKEEIEELNKSESIQKLRKKKIKRSVVNAKKIIQRTSKEHW